jgi:hypothetical protein
MKLLFENPWPLFWLGCAVVLLLSAAYYNHRRTQTVVAIGVVVVCVAAAFTIDRLVETDTERIEHVLEQAVAALRANDRAALLELIAPDATRTRDKVHYWLDRLRIVSVSISHLVVVFDNEQQPEYARARFFGTARVAVKSHPQDSPLSQVQPYVEPRCEVALRKVAGQWRITGYIDGYTSHSSH